MPQPCSICIHPEREAIDAALVAGTPNRRIATQYGMSEGAVRRHKAHIPPEVARARDAEKVFGREALAARIVRLVEHTEATLKMTDAPEASIADRCVAAREVRGNLTLIAKIAGEIQTAPTVNVIQSPEWIEVQTVILHALAPYPDARIAVADALEVCEP